ncbi:melanopsin isoform X3 [Pogona vitticeps]
MNTQSFQKSILCPSTDFNCSKTIGALNDSEVNAYKLMVDLTPSSSTEHTMLNLPDPFPTADVPAHAHYTIGGVILAVGITGTLGNLLVIYAFCRSRGLRTPANMFIINLAVSDFLMSITQCPVFFTNSLNRRWIFGKKGAYVPEGLLTSCSWDYITFTPSIRAYTMLLFCFVFFIPLIVIIYSYVFIFRAIKKANRTVRRISLDSGKESQRIYQKIKNEWKMAKIALVIISFFVISWSPYSVVALVAFAGYSHLLTPYMNSVPAVIAKASTIHNPIIYAIAHPKYRMVIAQFLPCLGFLLRVSHKDSRSFSNPSTRRPTVTSQSSDINGLPRGHRKLSSVSDSESEWTDTEADLASLNSRGANGPVSHEMGEDTAETSDIKVKSKLRSHDSGIFERTSVDADDISMVEELHFGAYSFEDSLAGEDLNAFGWRREDSYYGPSTAAQIPSIIVTFSNVQRTDLPLESNSDVINSRTSGYSWERNSSTHLEWLCQGSALAPTSGKSMCQLSVENLPKLL